MGANVEHIRGCTGKRAYDNIYTAAKMMVVLQRKSKKKHLRLYECPYCKKFHLTSEFK